MVFATHFPDNISRICEVYSVLSWKEYRLLSEIRREKEVLGRKVVNRVREKESRSQQKR